MPFICKIVSRLLWEKFCAAAVLAGTVAGRVHGLLHFCPAVQIAATAQKHCRGQQDFLFLRMPADIAGADPGYGKARDNGFFCCLYGVLPVRPVPAVLPFEPDAGGRSALTGRQ